MIPFTVTIPPAKRDKKLPERLLAERDGILAWALQGCLEWQRMGLRPPAAVMSATEDYFEAEDAMGRWVAERCNQGSNYKALTATLTPGDCSDGMSDRRFPFVATIALGGETLQGCGYTDRQKFTGDKAP
jgi:uncharacterized membrane protein